MSRIKQYYEDITWNIIDCMDTELYGARDAYFPDWENGGREAAMRNGISTGDQMP